MRPTPLFPTMLRTERPDVAAALLEGKVAIITDGTPLTGGAGDLHQFPGCC